VTKADPADIDIMRVQTHSPQTRVHRSAAAASPPEASHVPTWISPPARPGEPEQRFDLHDREALLIIRGRGKDSLRGVGIEERSQGILRGGLVPARFHSPGPVPGGRRTVEPGLFRYP